MKSLFSVRQQLKFFITSQAGQGGILVVALIGMFAIVSGWLVSSFTQTNTNSISQLNYKASLDLCQGNLIAYLSNSSAIQNTINQQKVGNGPFACFGGNCSAAPQEFKIYPPAGTDFYFDGTTNSTQGFDVQGLVCGSNSPRCIVRVKLSWMPTCGSCTVSQVSQIQVNAIFSVNSDGSFPINASQWNFTKVLQ